MKSTWKMTSVAALAIAALALGGCATGSRGGAGAGDDGDKKLLTVTPKAAGELDHATWNLPYGEPASLDPIKAFNYPENEVVANLCDSLVQLQPDLTMKPHLASKWEMKDPKTYVLQIEDGVTFWDGSAMTMQDVIYSIERNLDPEEGSYWAESAENIAAVKQTGDWELTITLNEPDATFIELLGTPIGTVVQEKQRKEAGQNYGNPEAGVMCTGPFSVQKWKQGQSIVLDRNDDYWNSDRMAHVKEFEIDFVVDPTAIGNSLATGEILGGYDVPLPAMSKLSGSSSGTVYEGQGMQLMAIIAQGDGPFADPKVRQAITRATDRQAIADTVFEGTAMPARSVVPELNWSAGPDVEKLRDEKLPDLSHDVDAAKQLMKDVDVDTSKAIKIAYPSERAFYADIINELGNGAAELGLTLEPVGVPSAQFGAFFSDAEARKGYDGFVTINYPSSPSPINYIASIATESGDQNFNDFSDPAIEKAVDQAREEADDTKRAEKSVEAEALMMEQLPWVPVAQLNTRLFMDNSVTGAPASFVYLNYPWAADVGAAK